MSWIFSHDEPIPAGCRKEILRSAEGEMARARLEEAASILGKQNAELTASRFGAYELADSLVEELRLLGLSVPENGEISSLSPNRWHFHEGERSLSEVRAAGHLHAVLLHPEQKRAFLDFLRRNHVSVSVEEGVEIARHFFFSEAISVLVRD